MEVYTPKNPPPDGGMIYPGAGIPLSTGSAWGTSITNNSANWNTAYGWGNHASAGYVTGTPWTSAGYITGISGSDVTTALGYTPLQSSDLTGYATETWVGLQGYVTGTPWTGEGYLTEEVDGSTTNELQDLSLVENTLSLSNSAATIDLSAYLDNTDAQAISLEGNTLSISGSAGTVDLSGYLDNTDDQTCAEVSGCVENAITGIVIDIPLTGAGTSGSHLGVTDGAISSAKMNWSNINALAPVQSGGVNWSSLLRVIQTAGINWDSVISSELQRSGINWSSLQASDIPTLNQNTTGTASNVSGTPALPNGTTATTQTAADNSTKLATTAYVDSGLGGKLSSVGPTNMNAVDFGSFTCNGTNCTVDNNSVALTTKTTGNYIKTITTSAPLTGGAAGAEGVDISMGFNWDTVTGGQLQKAGINWTDITEATITGVNWSNLAVLNGANVFSAAQTINGSVTGNAGTVTNGVYTTGAGTVFLAPSGSAASLTSFPTLNQNTTGTAAGLTAQYIDWNSGSGGSSIANKPTIPVATSYSKSFVLTNPTASADGPVWRAPEDVTITAEHLLVMDGTNVVGQLWEYDANGANGAVVDSSDITGTAGTNANDDGSLSNDSIDANDYVGWVTTSVSGAVTKCIVTFEYELT